MPNQPAPGIAQGLKLLFRYLWPQRWRWFGLILLSLLMVAANLLDPLIIKFLIDSVLIPRNRDLLLPVMLAFIAARGSGTVLIYVYGVAYEGFLQGIIARARNDLFAHIEHKRLEFFRERQVGDLLRSLTEDIRSVRSIAATTESIGVNVLRALFMFAVVLALSWPLAAVFVISLPLFVWMQGVYRRKLQTQAALSASTDVRLLNFLQEQLSNIFLVKIYGQESRQLGREKRIGAAGAEHNTRLTAGVLGTAMLTTGVVAGVSAAVLWIGGYGVLTGFMEVGTLVAVYAYIFQLFGPVAGIAMAPSAMQSSLVSAHRVLDILAAEEEPDRGRKPAAPLRGDIRFNNVSFAYPGRPKDWILRSVSLHIRPGECVAVMGASGSGKTSLALLLLGFYEAQKGEILIDGAPVQSYAKSFLRKHIAVHAQVPLLFPGTVAENIAFARPDASREEIEAAARRAAIHQATMELPRGYETPIGHGGTKLSEGEIQRVALARTFLRKPDVYIFDEPTSSLDAKNEAGVMRSIRALTKGKTTIVITHHPGILKYADRVFTLSNGSLTESYPQ